MTIAEAESESETESQVDTKVDTKVGTNTSDVDRDMSVELVEEGERKPSASTRGLRNMFNMSSTSNSNSNSNRSSNRARRKRASVYTNLSYVPGVKIRLFSPPRQRQKWGSDQVLPHVNWGDLFYDLFYVAGFYNLGNILVSDPSPLGILYFYTCFACILFLWNNKTHYDSQFTDGDDIYHPVFQTVVLAALATAVANISPVYRMSNPTEYVDMFVFALALVLATMLNIIRHVVCLASGRGQRHNIMQTAKSNIRTLCIPLVFFLAAAVIAGNAHYRSDSYYDDGYDNAGAGAGADADADADGYDNGYDDDEKRFRQLAEAAPTSCDDTNKNNIPVILMLTGFVLYQLELIIRVCLLFPKDGSHKKNTIPINVDFVIHRFGELTMLVLGESVLSLLIVDGQTSMYHRTFYFGIITVVLLQVLHFRSQPNDAATHAYRRHKNAGILYSQTVYFYFAALIAVGASYKLLLYSISDMSDEKRRLNSVVADAVADQLAYHHSNYYSGYDPRWLAAKGGDGCGPSGAEKKEMVAHLFSGALAIVFFCLDVMVLAHVGLKKEVDKCKLYGQTCKRTGARIMRYNLKGLIFVVLPRVVITIFIATLSSWKTKPKPSVLAGLGLAAVFCQLVIRFLGTLLFSNAGHVSGHGHGHIQGHGHGHSGYITDEDEEVICEDDSDLMET